MDKIYKSIGLMSGTSMDGIDLALIESDGKKIIRRKNFSYQPYKKEFKHRLEALIHNASKPMEIKQIENELTLLHAQLVQDFLAQNAISKNEIDVIGFHGHTICHDPDRRITWQIGNPHLLAALTGIDVVADFRARDVALRGQGAPLVPIYHFHLFFNQVRPTAVLNIGGISNVTYFSGDGEDDVEAFDICFGNAPLDDLMKQKFGRDFDEDGMLAKSGEIDFLLADRLLQNEIFHRQPPKSFDRDDFVGIVAPINSLKVEDALATFAYMHAKAVAFNLEFLQQKPHEIFVCGGGRKNAAIMDELKKWLSKVAVKTVEELGFDGDSIEAEAFAFLAIRHLLGLPISFSKTTGIYSSKPSNAPNSSGFAMNHEPIEEGKKSACGGVLFKAA